MVPTGRLVCTSGAGESPPRRWKDTLTGQIIGTPAYLAPERLEGKRATPESDLYSLGVVLYEALAGRKPFSGDTPIVLAHAVHTAVPEPLRLVRPDIDASLAATVGRAMEKSPERRFRTAKDMADSLASTTTPQEGISGLATTEAPTQGDATRLVSGGSTQRFPSQPVTERPDADQPAGRAWRHHHFRLVAIELGEQVQQVRAAATAGDVDGARARLAEIDTAVEAHRATGEISEDDATRITAATSDVGQSLALLATSTSTPAATAPPPGRTDDPPVDAPDHDDDDGDDAEKDGENDPPKWPKEQGNRGRGQG